MNDDVPRFSLQDGTIYVRAGDPAIVMWSGRPLNASVVQVAHIPQSSGPVVLLDDTESAENLVRIDSLGNIVWVAELPEGNARDFYVQVGWDGVHLTANSWSCYRVVLDADTGRITERVFTK